jgi:D-amino peptidase
MKKIYISADIEGVSGIADMSESVMGKPGYEEFRNRMTAEVKAACEGALAAGVESIIVKDAHDSARNIHHIDLPREVELIRGWGGQKSMMVQGINNSFDGIIYIGYHASASSGGNPLAHSMSLGIHSITVNGLPGSEFLLHSWLSAARGVPSIFISGDELICRQAEGLFPEIKSVSTGVASGGSIQARHPLLVQDEIREQVEFACKQGAGIPILADEFVLQIVFRSAQLALRNSQYPGVILTDPHTINFTCSDIEDIMRVMLFMI